MTEEQAKALTRAGDERALARLWLASIKGRGIRLTAEDVHDITARGLDQALEQRLINAMDRLRETNPGGAA